MDALRPTVATPPVSVIICAYTEQRWDDLLGAVASLEQQTYPASEVIVVIDHNEQLFRRALVTLSGALVIENQEPQGLSGARNSGIARAHGEIVAFMDEDATAEPTWLEHLVGCYYGDEVLGVGGAIVPRWSEARPAWFPQEFDWVVGCTYRGMPTDVADVRNLIGCNMSFRRAIFAEVGGFRNGIGRIGTLPIGCEETELCIRVAQARPDGAILFQPRARVHHRVPPVRAAWRYFRSRCYAEGISKATIARFVGTNDALSSERTYMLQTLPRGVLAGVLDTLRGDRAGLGRSGAIVAGLAATLAGYLKGTADRMRGRWLDHNASASERHPSRLPGR